MMLIGSTRLRSLKRHLHSVKSGSKIIIGLTELTGRSEQLIAAGFPADAKSGLRLLPAIVGPVSRFNADGRLEKHTDQPKETFYVSFSWEWKQWDGTWQSDTVHQERERYKRTWVEAPAIELELREEEGGALVLASDSLEYIEANEAALLLRINLFRELFGAVEILTEELEKYVKVEVKQLNWEVLPAGEMPWPQLQAHVKPLIDDMGVRKGPAAESRLQLLTEEGKAKQAAVGLAGFRGYIAFDFGKYRVLESLYYGNATYVFGSEWTEVAQLSKAEIIRGDLAKARLIHREGWEAEVRKWLK
jgi:hypothetical protein